MKKLASILLATGVIASALTADSAINAVKVKSNLDNVDYKSSVWKGAKFSDVTLYPQTAIKMNDKKANELNADNKAIAAKIAAVYNDSKIAFIIKWPDGTKSVQQGNSTDVYGDGFAVQFAQNFSNPAELPYIGMGSEGRAVVIHLQKETGITYEPNGHSEVNYQINPNQTNLFGKDLEVYNKQVKTLGNADYQKSFVGEGFRSMTEIKDGSTAGATSTMNYAGKGWSGTLSRSLKDDYLDLNAAAIPVAFAVWDGSKLGRNGVKYLTPWTAVVLKKGDNALVAALESKTQGDVQKGKDAVIANGCTGCHQVEKTDAASLMAPSLVDIGGYASADYLRESLVKPSAVVVPGYNRNAHSNYAWYNLENGKRVSAMTDYSFLDKADLDNMVAYLQTLKVGAK
jgi:complex iron-sulfur molybdoenzyme family reductase subunit gamma